MDHVSVREGYRVWHGASHLDDGRLAPVVGEQFDGWNQATATDGKYKGGDHIPGMNVGGWYDAGDFDLEEPAQLSVIQSMALAYREFNVRYDVARNDCQFRVVLAVLTEDDSRSFDYAKSGFHVNCFRSRCVLQGLKPIYFFAACGTTEVVP